MKKLLLRALARTFAALSHFDLDHASQSSMGVR
jgi:hypothetical protein